jgi:hypothetical protein
MTKFVRLCCIISFFGLLGSANAAITFDFSGTVTQVGVDEVFGDIAFGDPFHGSFSFDPFAPSLIPGDPTTASYRSNAPLGMTVSIDGHDFSVSDGLNLGILNSGLADQYTVLAQSGAGDLTLELFLQDNTASVFANDHLPAAAPSLAAFGQRDFHLDAVIGGGQIQVDGQLSALATQAVPEPNPAGPFLACAVVLFALAKWGRMASGAPVGNRR